MVLVFYGFGSNEQLRESDEIERFIFTPHFTPSTQLLTVRSLFVRFTPHAPFHIRSTHSARSVPYSLTTLLTNP